MRGELFSKVHWHSAREQTLRSVVADVDALDRHILANSALAEHLEKIVAKHSFTVAKLEIDKIRGKRREAERDIDDYGDRKTITYTVLDVSIPFVGNRESFEITPTHSHTIYADCEVRENLVVLTVTDGAQAQNEVDYFVKHVSENLENLRSDSANWTSDLKEAISHAVHRRQADLTAQHVRDGKLRFPVD